MSKPNKKGKATDATLSDLHGLLAGEFKKIIEAGDAPASTLNVIRQFLKDNDIQAVPVPKSPMGDLTGALPTDFQFEDDNES